MLLNIEDYKDAPMFAALKELNAEMIKHDIPPVNLKVIGGFAMMVNDDRSKEGVTDIDYIGNPLPKDLCEISDMIGMKYNLGHSWINSDVLLSGTTLEDMEFSTGKLHFYPAFDLEKIKIDVLDRYDLLRMKVIAIDTQLSGMDFGSDFTRQKDFADILKLKETLNLSEEEFVGLTKDYVFDTQTYRLIKYYEDGGLEKVNSSIREIKAERMKKYLENINNPQRTYSESPLLADMINKAYAKINAEKER